MLQQHVDTAMRWNAAKHNVSRFLPFPFCGQMHGVSDLRRPCLKFPCKAVRLHSQFGIDVVTLVVSAEAVGMRGIIVGDRGQRLKFLPAVRTHALAFDQQNKTIELVLNAFRLDQFQRFSRSTRDRDRTGPVTS